MWLFIFPSFSLVQYSLVSYSLLHAKNCCTPGLHVHHQLPGFTQTLVHWVSDAIQSSHHLLSPSPPDPNPSQHQGLFQWVNSSHQVAKVLLQLQHPRLISFRVDWLELLVLKGTLKSLFQHHSSKASILRHSAFFRIQLSHPYMMEKTIALTRFCWQSNVSAF